MNVFTVIYLITVLIDANGHLFTRQTRVESIEKCFERAAEFMQVKQRLGEPKHIKAGCDGELAEETPI